MKLMTAKKMVIKKNLKEFYSYVAKLKRVKRQGWLNGGLALSECESVADHSFGTAILAISLMKDYPDLDKEKLFKMSIIHDIAESIVGDITPHDNVTDKEKQTIELKAAEKILMPISEELFEIFKEYQKKVTPEARLISQIDKLEMAYQAEHYEDKINTSEFKESARKKITDTDNKETTDNNGIDINNSVKDLL